MPNQRQGRLDRLVLAAFALTLIACAAVVIPVAIHRSHSGSENRSAQLDSRKAPSHAGVRLVPKETPPLPARLVGYWHADGVVVGGDGKVYPLRHQLLAPRRSFYRACRQHQCGLRLDPSGVGLHTAWVRGRRPYWTASFRHYGSLTCGPPSNTVWVPFDTRWRFTLTPRMTHLEAIEQIITPPICAAKTVTIRWSAQRGG